MRIALNLKGVTPDERTFVHLRMGNQRAQDYLALNPQGLVPALEIDPSHVLTQSLAICEYLEETHPSPPLLPRDPVERARVRAIALAIACEIHPLNNTRVLRYLAHELKLEEETRNTWYRHWVRDGLEKFEQELARLPAGTYCYGDTPTLADCCLVPQIFNGKRFDVDFGGLARTMAAFDACMRHPAFQKAQPSNCPDNEA